MRETLGKRRGEDIMKSVLTRNGRLRVVVVPTLVVLIVVCAAACMLIGRFSVSGGRGRRCAPTFLGGLRCLRASNSVVVFDLRAPRIIVAILNGGGLSSRARLFQSLFQPLATPDTWASRRARAWAR